jgi:hypothetical protein
LLKPQKPSSRGSCLPRLLCAAAFVFRFCLDRTGAVYKMSASALRRLNADALILKLLENWASSLGALRHGFCDGTTAKNGTTARNSVRRIGFMAEVLAPRRFCTPL